MGHPSWYPYVVLPRFVRIARESCRRPSFNYISRPRHRSHRTYRAECRRTRAGPCRPVRAAGQNGSRRLACQQRGVPRRQPRRAPLGMGLRVSADPLVLHPRLAIRIRLRHLHRAHGHARGRRDRPHAKYLVLRGARAKAALLLEPRGNRALLHLRQARPRRLGHGRPPGAPGPHHWLQSRRYADLRRPAVACRRRHYLHL